MVKIDNTILSNAIEVISTARGDRIISPAIAYWILRNSRDVDIDIYLRLLSTIFINSDIANTKIDYNGDTFLLLGLRSIREDKRRVSLDQEEKQFVVNEAITRTEKHDSFPYGIKYEILRNSSWSLEEKKNLITDFWENSEDFVKELEQWEYAVVNDEANFKGNKVSLFEKRLMYKYPYLELFRFYQDYQVTDKIWDEIEFCRLMHELISQQKKDDSKQLIKK